MATARKEHICEICKGKIVVGEDVYVNQTTHLVSHYNCQPIRSSAKRQSPRWRAEELADELGFLPHAEAMGTRWSVFLLPDAARSRATGRVEPETRDEQGALW